MSSLSLKTEGKVNTSEFAGISVSKFESDIEVTSSKAWDISSVVNAVCASREDFLLGNRDDIAEDGDAVELDIKFEVLDSNVILDFTAGMDSVIYASSRFLVKGNISWLPRISSVTAVLPSGGITGRETGNTEHSNKKSLHDL